MKKYYLTSRFKLLSAAIWSLPMIFIFPVLYLLNTMTSESWTFSFSAAYLFVQILSTVLLIHKDFIVVTEDGIQLNRVMLSRKANWKQVENITYSQWWLYGKLEGFIVDKPETKFKSGNPFYLPVMQAPKGFIPLSCFSDNWRDSELGQQIKQYAPHLFEKEKSAQSA